MVPDQFVAPSERVAAALAASFGRVSLLVETDGTIDWVTPSIERLMGWSPSALIGTSLFDLYEPESRSYSERGFEGARRDPAGAGHQLGSISRTAHVRCADGTSLSVESRPTIISSDGAIDGVLVEWTPVPDRSWLLTAIDAVTLRRPLAETLHAVVSLVESLLYNVQVGVAIFDGSRWRLPVSPSGRDPDPLTYHLPLPDDPRWDDGFILLSGEPEVFEWAGEGLGVGVTPLRGADRSVLGAMVLLHVRADRLPIVVVGGENLYEVAVRLAALTVTDSGHREELRAAAEIDPLTGLLNRAGLRRELSQIRCPNGQSLAVMYLDLDDFKPVNDQHGHGAGDEVLAAVGQRLRDVLRDRDVACRLGGDEFVLLCSGLWTVAALERFADRVFEAVSKPIQLGAYDVEVHLSAGLAVGPVDVAERLLNDADVALIQAKRLGKRRAVIGTTEFAAETTDSPVP